MPDSQPQVIRLLIVDDHALFREGLAALLARVADFEVIGACASAKDALRFLDSDKPGVILLDFDLGPESAARFAREAKTGGFTGQILIVTAGMSQQEALQLIQAGVAGIFHKHNPLELLCSTIRQVAAGDVCLEKNYLKPLFQTVDQTGSMRDPELSERDRLILRHVFQGLANKEIGARLDLSEGAVKACLRQLFHKLSVHTRAQLVKVALEQYRDQL